MNGIELNDEVLGSIAEAMWNLEAATPDWNQLEPIDDAIKVEFKTMAKAAVEKYLEIIEL